MNAYFIISLIISIIVILWLLVGYIRAVRNYRNLIKKNNELEKFKGYEEEVEQLKNNFIHDLPKGMEKISSLWADTIQYLDVLEQDYRCYRRHRERAKVWQSSEVKWLRGLAQENSELIYKLEIAESKYILALTLLKEKYGEEDLDADWSYYISSIKEAREEEERRYEEKIHKLQEDEANLKRSVERYSEQCRRLAEYEIKKKVTKGQLTKINDLFLEIEAQKRVLIAKEKDVYLIEQNIERIEQEISRAKERIIEANDTPEILGKMAAAWAEYKELIWDKAIAYLLVKNRPISFEKAEELRRNLRQYKEEIFVKYKETQYKYEYLLSLFPELQEYIDGEAVRERTEEVTEEYKDRRVGYLTKEEWESLTDTQKSQLALDRYNEQSKRTKAQVGRDYEEYVAYLFRKKLKGCDVVMFGEQKGLNDLGRDLIVKHKGKVYVVQCKRWSADKVIREKHIMQLFGSTIEYCWEWKRKGVHPIEMVGKSIIPVFVTTTEFSDTAKQFSERLGVVAVQEQIGDYPQIKCNVGADGEKIYHLPFDQQYNRVIIEPKKGEFMATTVEEAEEKGFRRAKKFYFV